TYQAPVKEKPVKDNVKAPVKGSLSVDASLKEKPIKGNVKAPVEVSVLKSSLSVDVVPDDVVLNKSAGNVGKEKLSIIVKEKSIGVVYTTKSSNQKDKPEVKYKVPVRVSRSKETHVKRKRNLLKGNENKKKVKVKLLKGKSKKEDFDSELETDDVGSSFDEVDRKPKKLKLKDGLKRKRNVSDSNSSALDDEKIRRLVNKLKKKVKKEESDEESVSKNPKKKERHLTLDEASHELYLLSFPTFRIRTSPSSLFSAIGNSRVDTLNFLEEICFSSLHNVTIDKMPSRLGRFVVANFNEKTYSLSLDTGNKIKVTHKKIHDILGVLVGGYSLFDLEERPVEHEFVRLWVGQFFPKALKDIQVNDIASKLVGAQEVDFFFKVNFLTLFTNTMGMSYGLKGHICLDVVRRLHEDCVITDIDWCCYIYVSLKDNKLPTGTNHYLGPFAFLILLYLDSTKFDEFLVVRTRPTIRKWSSYLMKQRQELELNDRVLGLLELHGEWTEAVGQETEGFTVILFKEPISFNDDDGNGDDDTGNGNDDGNRDDDVGVDNDVNEDDDDNGDGNDSSVNDKEVHVEDDGNRVVDGNGDGHDDNGGSKKHVESTGKQSVDPTDPTGEEIDEYLYGHALDAINEYFLRMEESDAGPVTPDRLATRVSKLSPSREKRMVKPSPYLLSPYMNKKTKVLPKITRLVVESKLQCDMLRRLRFKYATKILLHEINVHAPKMLELAKEFD
ncbi:hypothetical protein Tco_1189879, partial [Tanacetum coccineum]